MTLQSFHFRNDIWEKESDPKTPTYLSSPYLYMIGTVGGMVRPFGDAHLVGKMGGLWAHPLRILHGWSLSMEMVDRTVPLEQANFCRLYGSHLVREFLIDPLRVSWTEFVSDSLPALISIVQVQNQSKVTWEGSIALNADVDLHSAWFSDWLVEENRVSVENDSLVFSTQMAGRAHTFLLGTSTAGASWKMPTKTQTSIKYQLSLPASATQEITGFVAVVHLGGKEAILEIQEQLIGNEMNLLQEKIENYQNLEQELSFNSSNSLLNHGWHAARLNLQLLASDYRPFMQPYFLAGLPEYPQLFGCDTTYTVPGALAAGFRSHVHHSLLALAEVASKQGGKVPHEITTNGRVYNPGNTQETPQFVIAVWDYFVWTGDIDFLRKLYPVCQRGMLEKLPREFGVPELPYLKGNGMVEVEGMAEFKLDVQAYYLHGLKLLQRMANILEDQNGIREVSERLNNFSSRFHSDWWIPSEELYADSMYVDGRSRLDGHWTVVVPIQLELLPRDKAHSSLQQILKGWVNRWGMVHTRYDDVRVWTLPTGLLALASFAHEDPEQGITLLENIAETNYFGSFGLLSELIPDGLCFIQLWSAGLLIQGIVEGLLGIRPEAYRHYLGVSPNIPVSWGEVELTGLKIGQHIVDFRVSHSRLFIRHRKGSVQLNVSYTCGKKTQKFPLLVGEEKHIGKPRAKR